MLIFEKNRLNKYWNARGHRFLLLFLIVIFFLFILKFISFKEDNLKKDWNERYNAYKAQFPEVVADFESLVMETCLDCNEVGAVQETFNEITGTFADKDKIYLDIKFLDLQKLRFINEKAINKNYGVLNTLNSKNEYVPIQISYKDKSVEARARLKGNWIDARDKKKLSLRIKVKNDKSILGLSRFSIHAPEVKGILSEWIFHKLIEYEKLINLRYEFIDVYINGRSIGLMAFEEHFDDILINNNHKRNGVILKIEETGWISGFMSLNEEDKKNFVFSFTDNVYPSAVVKSFSDISPNDPLYSQFVKGVNLFEGFRNDALAANEVFDLEKFAKLFAIADLMGNPHSLKMKNIKFYFNPFTSLIEPIGYDQHHPVLTARRILPQYRSFKSFNDKLLWPGQLLKDEEFYRLYIEALNEISEPEYLDQFVDYVRVELDSNLKKIHGEYPTYEYEPLIQKLIGNQVFIKNALNPPHLVNSFVQSYKDGVIDLKVGNIYLMPIEVDKILFKNQNYEFSVSSKERNILDNQVAAKDFNGTVKYENFSFDLRNHIDSKDLEIIDFNELKIVTRVFGTNNEITDIVNNWPLKFVKNEKYSNLTDLNFISINDDEIYFNNGNITLEKNLVIPPGFKVKIGKGTKIDLINSSFITSYSPIFAYGSKDHPIEFTSSDKTGRGLLLLNSKVQSNFDFVIFSNLSNYENKGLSGAISIYESKVFFNNTSFKKNINGDDFLNIVRSKFKIHNSLFSDIKFDALDSDFSSGEIQNTFFHNIGNDAIDGSGSILNIDNIVLDNIGDKGLSAGEESNFNIRNSRINNAEINLASKDGSEIYADNLLLSNGYYGLTAYNKKDEFTYGKIIVNNLELDNINLQYILDEKSTIIINGLSMNPTKKRIIKIFLNPTKSQN